MSAPQLNTEFAPSRLIKGGWQLAGGHGAIDTAQALDDMAAHVEADITTFDCADIYTGVESLIGRFMRERPKLAPLLRVHTKYVPDLDALPRVSASDVDAAVDRSLTRLGVSHLELVQFHWWDYAVSRYVEVARELARIQREGRIRHVGVTNFDTRAIKQIVDAGISVAAHQVQFSLLDRRPTTSMTAYCQAHGIGLLCYGTVAGGFLSERWLGAPEPSEPLNNRSLTKYKLIIDEFGGWALFQELLAVLQTIASRHEVTIGSVAIRWVLEQPGVRSVIVGSRNALHLPSTTSALRFRLSAIDHAELAGILSRSRGPSGDVYTLERDRDGIHGRIMRYNLSRSS
jgi:aryl-alcohol dehydrogenase-like predicted oxidoreductase